jgi:hypothetical protein
MVALLTIAARPEIFSDLSLSLSLSSDFKWPKLTSAQEAGSYRRPIKTA